MKRSIRRIEQATQDALVLRMRGAGASFIQIARAIGATEAGSGLYAYRAALRRHEQVPTPLWSPDEALVADPTFAPWAAGFFDGEGCVYGGEGLHRGFRRFTFAIQVTQAVREPLDAMQRRWGGTVRFKGRAQAHHRDQWIWAIRGEEAGIFLAEILPYLRVKREVARIAIPIFLSTHRHGVGLNDQEAAQRRSAIVVIKAANHRGRAAS